MLDFDIITITIGCCLLIIMITLLKKYRCKDNIYLLMFSVFYIYILFVLKYTIFPIPVDSDFIEIMRSADKSNYNLIPFNFGFKYLFGTQVLYNILLSIPFGFGLSYITKTKASKLIAFGIIFGITIECLQLIISLILGFNYRSIDTNDIIFNFIGVIIGYLIFKVFSVSFVKIVNKFNMQLNPFLNYIFDISKRSINSSHNNENIP